MSDIAAALSSIGVSIEELETSVGPAPQGGNLFTAKATLVLPAGSGIDAAQAALEDVAQDLMVDLEISGDQPGN